MVIGQGALQGPFIPQCDTKMSDNAEGDGVGGRGLHPAGCLVGMWGVTSRAKDLVRALDGLLRLLPFDYYKRDALVEVRRALIRHSRCFQHDPQ